MQIHEQVATFLRTAKKPLLVVLGPTASGKTAYSIDLAHAIPSFDTHWKSVEIINADSRQFYRGLDIGTAKITEGEMQGIPHHLIDVLDPTEEVTISWYKEKATEIIEDCHTRDVVPMLVGGSMLYISAVVDGLEPLPVAPPEMRKRLEEEYDKDNGWSLYDRLQQIDPTTAASFDKMNKVYVVRAMELYEMTGRPPSQIKKTLPPPYDIFHIGITRSRRELTERIDERVDQMLRHGWIEEVEGLIDRGYTPKDPGMKSHGYKEIMAWLGSEERNTEVLREAIASKIRQYAKRQVTWWKNDDRIHWITL